MTVTESEKQFLCEYDIKQFDMPLTTVDVVIYSIKDNILQVLLVKRSEHPAKGQWALPGGFVDLVNDSNLAETARRKLKDKTGVSAPYLEQVATFSGAERDPRGWSVTVTYYALLAWDEIRSEADDAQTRWSPVEDVQMSQVLAFDHNAILETCTERLRSKALYTSIVINLMPEAFTLTELQQVFEIILARNLEKKSFRRRILDADLLEETGTLKTGNNRPAKMYRAKSGSDHYLFPRIIEGAR